MQVQIAEVIPSQKSARSGKMMPPKVVLHDGTECVLSKDLNIAAFQEGEWGEATIEVEVRGNYTNHRITAYQRTMPAGVQPPVNSPTLQPSRESQERAVWDAKDRSIAYQSSAKVAGEVVAAMISQHPNMGVEDAIGVLKKITTELYEGCLLAKMGRIATAADPFAEE